MSLGTPPANSSSPTLGISTGDAVFWPKSGDASQYPAADIENMRSLYKAEVTQIDFWMGQLLATLREKKLQDDTAILFCSDHGYYLGEHGLIGKPLRGKEPLKIYEELGHIPLLDPSPESAGCRENDSRTDPTARFVRHRSGLGGNPGGAVEPGAFSGPDARRPAQSAKIRRRRLPSAQGSRRLPERLDGRMGFGVLARARTGRLGTVSRPDRSAARAQRDREAPRTSPGTFPPPRPVDGRTGRLPGPAKTNASQQAFHDVG